MVFRPRLIFLRIPLLGGNLVFLGFFGYATFRVSPGSSSCVSDCDRHVLVYLSLSDSERPTSAPIVSCVRLIDASFSTVSY